MKKSLSVAVATLVLALATTPAFAGHAGQFGLGVLNSSAPVGVFIGVNDQTTVHFGIGFEKNDVPEGSGAIETQFTIAGDLEYDIWSGENWGFGVFPGIAFGIASPEGDGDSGTAIDIALNLGGHADLISNFSAYFRHGLNISIVDTGAEGADSLTNFGTTGWNLGELGVAFWFN
jgi:hypothetical protein